MNKFMVVGRVTKTPEPRVVGGDIPMVILSVAVKRNFKNTKGEYDTDFFNFKAFRKTAEHIHLWIAKGDLVEIEGSVINSNYDDNGKTVYQNDFAIKNIQRLVRPK